MDGWRGRATGTKEPRYFWEYRCAVGALNYESEASFNRAFKQFTGQTPGAIRRGAQSRTP